MVKYFEFLEIAILEDLSNLIVSKFWNFEILQATLKHPKEK